MRSLERRLKRISQLTPIIIADKRDSMTTLSDKVINGIMESDFVVPILTKNSMYTQWINQEIGFAQAKGKTIKPIVEQQIMNKLRGFIHSQIDIPYNYKSHSDLKKERKGFRKCCDILLEDLMMDAKGKVKTVDTVTLSDIFTDKWLNNYEFPNGQRGKEIVEIQNGNRYYSNDNFVFLLDKIYISDDHKIIKFRKNGVNGDERTAYNELELIRPGVYSGTEEKNKVTYSKIGHK
jgi:hypothetical protein